jgi:hypothetical protein
VLKLKNSSLAESIARDFNAELTMLFQRYKNVFKSMQKLDQYVFSRDEEKARAELEWACDRLMVDFPAHGEKIDEREARKEYARVMSLTHPDKTLGQFDATRENYEAAQRAYGLVRAYNRKVEKRPLSVEVTTDADGTGSNGDD